MGFAPIGLTRTSHTTGTGDEKRFIRDFFVLSLRSVNLEDVELFIWDHTKERVYERTLDILDQDTDVLIRGAAFHWYSADHFKALRIISEQFPEKILIHPESCLEYYRLDKNDMPINAQKYAHDLIGDLNNGALAFCDWNLVLDQQGGLNHVRNFCDATFKFSYRYWGTGRAEFLCVYLPFQPIHPRRSERHHLFPVHRFA
jgi:glucosylceramidase